MKLSMLPRPPGRRRASCVASKVSHSAQPFKRSLSRSLWMRQWPVWKSKSCEPGPSAVVLVSLMEFSSCADLLGTSGVERVVDQRLQALDEADHARQAGVFLERRLVLPARVDAEEPMAADRPEGVDLPASRRLAGRDEVGHDVTSPRDPSPCPRPRGGDGGETNGGWVAGGGARRGQSSPTDWPAIGKPPGSRRRRMSRAR